MKRPPLTARVHNRAARMAAKAWRQRHPEEWDATWDVVQQAVLITRPGTDAKGLWSYTMAGMLATIAEENPEEWTELRTQALADAKAELGWVDGRAEANKAKGKDQYRSGGRWARAEP